MERVIHFLFKTMSGRLVLLVLIAMGVAYAARVAMVDMPAMREKENAGVGSAMLESMGEILTDRADANGLPALTQWHPPSVPCAASSKFSSPADPIWTDLGLKPDESTEFQYRFKSNDAGAYLIWARRDSDCDGFYAVWVLEGRAGSTLGQNITAQNILE